MTQDMLRSPPGGEPVALHGDSQRTALRRRLSRLLWARVAIAASVLAVTTLLVGAGREDAEAAENGLYATLAVAFLASALFGAGLRLRVPLGWLATGQIGIDVALVSALVTFAGGADAAFSFLYLPIAVYGAILFGRRGAYGAAALASFGYGAALIIEPRLGSGLTLYEGSHGFEAAVISWGVHTGALLLVALLSSMLARDLSRAGERIDEQASSLERLRTLYQRTVESLTSGLITLDERDRVTSFNPEAERISGRPAWWAMGRSLEEVLPGASSVLAGSVPTPEAGTGRRRLAFRNPRGEQRFLGLAASRLRDEGGRVVIFQDVTDVVAMEQSLRRSERLAGVGQLAADMAHEIRNPLAAISGSVEMLCSGLETGDADREARRLMDIVIREIDRLDALIADFLLYARPTPPKLDTVRLAPLLGEIADMCRAALPDGIDLQLDVPETASVLGDAKQLRQALWNLVANAQQAVGERGCICIRVQESTQAQADATGSREVGGSHGVSICIADDGGGIAPENLERIFDPFFTTKVGGTGLGLPTVYRIVESHGGGLQVESTPGEGTQFELRLPAGESPFGAGETH